MSGLPYSTVNSLLRGKSDSPNLKTLIRIATAFNMTIVEFLDVPEIIEFSEDDLEDESERNEGQEETNKALREVVHRGDYYRRETYRLTGSYIPTFPHPAHGCTHITTHNFP